MCVLVTFEDVFEPCCFVFPCVSLEGFESFSSGRLAFREVLFSPFCGAGAFRFLHFSSCSCGSHLCADCVSPCARFFVRVLVDVGVLVSVP